MLIILNNIVSKAVIGGKDNFQGNIFKELRDYLRYHPRNYHRSPRYPKMWDGYNYLLKENGDFPTGFVPYVISFAKDKGLDIKIEDRRINKVKFKPGELDVTMPKFTLAPHQVKLVRSLRNSKLDIDDKQVLWRRGIWNAATNAGKTAAFAAVLKNVEDPRAILFVSSESLYYQHLAFYNEVFGKENVGRLGKRDPVLKKQRGISKYQTVYEKGKILTIAMIKSTINMLKKDIRLVSDFASYYNIKAVDESHEAGGDQYIEVLTSIEAGMTLFMSGTPLDSADQEVNLKNIGLSGPVLHKVSKKELMDSGFSMRPKIKVYTTGMGTAALTWPQEQEMGIFQNKMRAQLIAQLIKERPDKKILITFDKQHHGELMYTTLLAMYPELMKVSDWVHGKDKARKLKLEKYIEGKTRILFTSTIMQQGINVKDIQTIIYAIAHKAQIALSQFMGRGERLDGENTEFEFIDFYDIGKYLAKHSRKRIAFYRAEELEVEFMYPALKSGTPKK